MLTWLRENRDGPYWRAGSVRARAVRPDPGRRRCSWPAGPTATATTRSGRSRRWATRARRWRLLAGPWAHADPASAIPGPRIDLDVEMVAWFDRWLRGTGSHEDRADVFVRTSTVPEPDLDLHEGYWVSGPWPVAGGSHVVELDGPRALDVEPDVGTAAWIDCAGHLPWGLSGDQREDDARSLTWDSAPPSGAVVGQPRVRLRLVAVRSGGVAVGQALRRLPRRHLGAGRPRDAGPRLPRPVRCRPRSCRARSSTSTCSSTPAPTSGRRARRCGSRSLARTGPTPSRRRPRSR